MQISKNTGAVQAAAGLALLGVQATLGWASASPGDALDEIVVTATRRSENLQVVPLAVSVVSPQMLESQNLADTGDLQRLVPGLEYKHANSPGNESFGIRGVTTQVVGSGVEQSVGVAFDGVPLARTVGSITDLVDIHAVEVLKGPQGMLFGKNASAGLINIVTNSPEIGKTETLLRASFGSLNLRQYSATVNVAVTDDSALRLTAWKYSHDGPVHEANTGQDMNNKNSDGARFKYRWQPSDALDLNFSADFTSHDANGTAYTIRSFNPANFTAGNAGALVQAWELARGVVPSDQNLTARGIDKAYYDKGHTSAYTGQADYSLGGGTLTSIVSYRDIYNDNPFDPWPTDNPYNQEALNQDTVRYSQISEEIRYASPSEERFRYVVGLYNFRMKLRDDLGISFNPPISDTAFELNLLNESYAAFGEGTFDITPKLKFTAGFRHTTDIDHASMKRSYLSANPVLIPGFTSGPDATFGPFSASVATTYNDISWRTGLQYQFLPDVMGYFTISRGYKGPGIGYELSTTASQLAASNNGVVKPEIVHAYDLGLKTQWFDRRLTVNLDVYDEIFDNFQTSLVLPDVQFSQVLANAPQLVSTGVDLTANWLVTPSFSLVATASYDHVRFTNFTDSPCYPGQTLAQGCINQQTNLDGKTLANTPKTTATLTARYEHSLGSKWKGYVQANDSYRSAVTYSSQGDPNVNQGGYSLVNLNAGVDTVDGRWGVSVYGTNVINKHYVDIIVAPGGGFFYLNDIGYEDLRNFGIALTAHF